VDDPEDLDQLAAGKAKEILALLSEPLWKIGWRRRPPPRDPEHRKLLRRLHAALIEVPRMAGAADARTRAAELLDFEPRSLGLDATAELVNAWDQLLIDHGPEGFVRGLLAVEQVRDASGQGPTTWREVFGEPMPKGDSTDAWHAIDAGAALGTTDQAARRMLSVLYAARGSLYELDRARMMQKAYYLWRLVPVLLVLIVGLAVLVGTIDDGPSGQTIFAAALAGALGGAVSGTFKLRDQVSRIGQLRAFQPAIVVQPLLGAAAGLFLLAVLESRLIDIDWGGQDWAEAAVFAFAAGFSEPFFLGVVSRITAIGEEDEPA
jgi:hypothetical protein